MGVLVIDVSSNNGAVNWAKVKAAGVTGTIVKASESVGYTNPYYKTHVTQARRAGLHVGHYHFARPEHNDPVSEARHFCATVGTLGLLDFKPALDYETWDHRSRAGRVAWIKAFNKVVRGELGQWPFFYSSQSQIEQLRFDRPVGNGLWIANYGPNDGRRHPVTAPRPWRKAHLHQFTNRGRVDGVRGNVDLSWAPRLTPLLAHPVRAGFAAVKNAL